MMTSAAAGQQRHELAVVGPVPRPAVQQHHRRAAAGPVVGEAESVDRRRLGACREYPAPGKAVSMTRPNGDHGSDLSKERPCRDAGTRSPARMALGSGC